MNTEAAEVAHPKATSIRKLHEVLTDIVRGADSTDEELRKALFPALSTQGALAAFSYSEWSIVGMSLNTQKAVANDVLEGGYETLNTYRKAALSKLKELRDQQEQPNRGTIDWYKAELAEKTSSLNRINNEIALMSQHLGEVLDLAHEMAVHSGRLEEFKKRQLQLLRKFK